MARQERRFVIVTPHQSIGRPGTEVTASQLNMTDEQLDDWVDAGHAREIHVRVGPAPSAVSKVTRTSKSDGSGDD